MSHASKEDKAWKKSPLYARITYILVCTIGGFILLPLAFGIGIGERLVDNG